MPHLHPHKYNTYNHVKCDSASESGAEEFHMTRHLSMESIEIHEHYNKTTDDSHSDTSSEDEHSLLDYEHTPVLTFTEHIITTPPTPHPKPSRTHLVPPPRPSKVTNKATSCKETTAGECKNQFQPHYPKSTRRTPLLPTLHVPAQQHIKRTLISGSPQHNSN